MHNPSERYSSRFKKTDFGEDISVEEIVKQVKPKQAWYIRKRLALGIKTVNEAKARYDACTNISISMQIQRKMLCVENAIRYMVE